MWQSRGDKVPPTYQTNNKRFCLTEKNPTETVKKRNINIIMQIEYNTTTHTAIYNGTEYKNSTLKRVNVFCDNIIIDNVKGRTMRAANYLKRIYEQSPITDTMAMELNTLINRVFLGSELDRNFYLDKILSIIEYKLLGVYKLSFTHPKAQQLENYIVSIKKDIEEYKNKGIKYTKNASKDNNTYPLLDL